MRMNRGVLGMALGAVMNTGLQASTFYRNWKTFRAYTLGPHEFIRQFSWLMLVITAGFFGLIGVLLQARAEEREEVREIEATLREKARGKGKA